MGRIRKSTALRFDMSSTEAAPVSAAGEMRVRPKADGTTLQLSWNTGAWFDMGAGGGGGGTPRLDEVLDPNIPATEPPTNRVKTFSMTDHSLVFGFTATQPEECFVITSTEPVTPGAGGSVLLLRASGATTEKSPLRIETRNAFAFSVAADGKVAIGAETGLVHKLNVYHTNTGGANVGVIHGSVALGAGNTAVTMTGSQLQVADAGNTTSLLSLKNVDFSLNRESSAVANTSLVCTNLDVNSNINANTLTLRSLHLNIQVHSSTLTNWEALRITAPGTALGGAVTNKRAIITEAGAGYTGLGTLTPSVQLHVAGAMLNEQTTGQVFTISKMIDSAETPQLDFVRSRTTGALGDEDFTGRIMFYGSFDSGATRKQLGFIQTSYNTDYGAPAGYVEIGAGEFNNARIALLQTDLGTSGVTIYGGNLTPYFQVQTAGFQFSHGTTGSIYYRDAAGYFVSRAPTTNGYVLTLVGGLPDWQAAPGGGGGALPAGAGTELQFRSSGSAFGAVPSSSVSGSTIELGGNLTLTSRFAVDGTGTKFIGVTSTNGMFYQDSFGYVLGIAYPLSQARVLKSSSNPTFPASWGQISLSTNFTAPNDILTGTLGVANGGTGLTAPGTSGNVLTSNGTSWVSSAPAAGSFPRLDQVLDANTSRSFDMAGNTFQVVSGTNAITVDNLGVKVSGSSTNCLWYSNSSGYLLPIAYTINRWLKSASSTSFPASWGAIDLASTAGDITGTLPVARGGTGLTSPGTSGNVLTSNGTSWVSSAPAAGGGSPGGSGTELQYRGGASTFSAVSGSSVDGSGNVVLGGGALTLQSSAAGSFFYMKAALATSGPTIYTERSRGTLASKSGVLAGDALYSMANHGYDSGLGLRQGVAIDFSAQANFSSTSAPTVYRLRTTHVNSVTPQGRMIIGASRTLTDNTLTDLFTITFATTDHVALGGEIHLIFVAKQVSGTVATHVYRRKISFIIGHNGATNTGMCNFREDSGGQASAGSTGGFSAIDHAINSDAAVGIGTPITQNVGSWNALTYKILANSDLTTFSQFTCYYNIFYHGEGELALPASA